MKHSAASRLTLALFVMTLAASAVGQEVTRLSPLADAGQWTLHAYGSVSFGDEAGEVYQGRFGGERHWPHGLSCELSGMAGFFDADPIDKEEAGEGAVVGFDAYLRWYFHQAEKWAMYTDAGVGCAWFSEEFPSLAGTSFNFEPQAGIGLTRRLGPELWLMAGARWHHISNGGVVGNGDNRGYDGAMLYLGWSWR